MSNGIYLIQENGELVKMTKTRYDSEDYFQAMLERYPDLLAGDQVDPQDPRRWLFVAREVSVHDYENVTGRWSLDHLFLDQDGIPTFVEVKRSTDHRIRREVVGQMLDYAANGTRYWTVEKLRQSAAETAEDIGTNLNKEIVNLLDDSEESAIEAFWDTVEGNLKEGRIRLLFVAEEKLAGSVLAFQPSFTNPSH